MTYKYINVPSYRCAEEKMCRHADVKLELEWNSDSKPNEATEENYILILSGRGSQALMGPIYWYNHFYVDRVNGVHITWLYITILVGINWIQADEIKRCMCLHGRSSWKWRYFSIMHCMNCSPQCNMQHEARARCFSPKEPFYDAIHCHKTNL